VLGVPEKFVFPVIAKSRRFGRGPGTALSIERVLCPDPNVKDQTSTCVTSYLAFVFDKAFECANSMLGAGLIFRTYSAASKN
jgi:hypothetical protein